MTLRIFVLAAFLAVAMAPAGPRAAGDDGALPPEDLAIRVREARIAGLKGQIARQRRLLEEIAEDHPADSSALAALMDLYHSLPDRSAEAAAARDALRRLLMDPQRRVPLALLQSFALDAAATREDLEMVVRALEGRLRSGPGGPEALLLLAGTHERLGGLEASREVLDRLLKLRNDPEVRQRCLYLDIELERWDDALALLRAQRKALGSDRLRLAALFIFSALGMTDELAREVGSIRAENLVFTRELIHPLIQAGFALHDGGHQEQARRWFRLLESRFEGDPSVRSAAEGLLGPRPAAEGRSQGLPVDLLNEGTALLSAGESHRAHPILERAAELMEDNDLAWFNLGLAAADLQRWEEAERAFHRAVTLSPGFLKALIQRAQSRLRLGRLETAAADARRALEMDPGARDAVLILYHCARERGDDEEARRLMRLYKGM